MSEVLTLFSTDRLPLILAAIFVHLALFSSVRLRDLFSFPISLASDLILVFDQRYNQSHGTPQTRRKDSYSIAVFLIILGLVSGLGLAVLTHFIPYGRIVDIMVLAVFLGIRPLMRMTRLMTRSLQSGMEEARAILTLLTGRVSLGLDKQAMATVGIDVVAVWTVQLVIAPIFWYALGGLPALFIFKLIDTASTMIDDRSTKARDFGAAPRLLATFFMIPAALLALLILLPGGLVPGTVSTKRGFSALKSGIRHGTPILRLPGVLFAGMLGTSSDGMPGIHQSDVKDHTVVTDDFEPADIAHLRKAARLAAMGVLTLIILLGSITILLRF